jgi:ribosomal protein L37AE/L43A
MERTSYELKYCERCGSLGLRRVHSGETYCEPCGQMLINYSFSGDMVRKSLFRRRKTPRPILSRAEGQPSLLRGRQQ